MNITTLNTIGLDGVIIKKTNTPSGGGSTELEGEYYLAKPNGWYWRFPKINTTVISPSATEWNDYFVAIASFIESLAIYDGIYKDYSSGRMIRLTHEETMFSIGKQLIYIKNKEDFTPIWAISEKAFEIEGMEFSSLYELINMEQPMTEAEFEAFVLENIGNQRITKEEYESLITA